MEKVEPNTVAEPVVRRPWVDPVIRELSISGETAGGFSPAPMETPFGSS